MKKTLILFSALIFMAFSSCRETTEMNTDGDMEESDTAVESEME